MRSLRVVFGQPDIEIDLHLLHRPIELLVEGDVMELVLDGQIESAGMVFDLAEVFGTPVGMRGRQMPFPAKKGTTGRSTGFDRSGAAIAVFSV